MITISIIPEKPNTGELIWRAMSGESESFGKTAGEALDALTAKLNGEAAGIPLLVRQLEPDRFFTLEQQQRLNDLMARWRAARDAGHTLPANEQTELESLVEAEVRGAGLRVEQTLASLNQ
jgi:hypothetical protein